MTNSDPAPDLPVPDHLGIVAAFLDGEPVDGAALKQALATDVGRDYLVDVLALRQCVGTMGPVRVLPGVHRPRERSLWRWTAAAAAALIASIGGYLVGERASFMADVHAARSHVEAVALFEPTPHAPQPTQVIELQVDVSPDVPGGD